MSGEFAQPRPDQGEVGTLTDREDFTELGPEMFPVGSLGHDLFPSILSGRARPRSLVTRHITEAPLPFKPDTSVHQTLVNAGIDTLGKLLACSKGELSSTGESSDFIAARAQSQLTRTADWMSITPHGRLLSALLYGPLGAVPPETEAELIAEVEEVLADAPIDERQRDIIRNRFGPDTWKTKTFEEIASNLPITSVRVRQVEQQAVTKIQAYLQNEPEKLKKLTRLLAFPNNALARHFGLVFRSEIPPNNWVGDLRLSVDELTALRVMLPGYFATYLEFECGLELLLMQQAPQTPGSNEAIGILKKKVAQFMRGVEQWGGHDLLPERYSDTSSLLVDGHESIPLADLGLPKEVVTALARHGYQTLGQLAKARWDRGSVLSVDSNERVNPNVFNSVRLIFPLLAMYLRAIKEQAEGGE